MFMFSCLLCCLFCLFDSVVRLVVLGVCLVALSLSFVFRLYVFTCFGDCYLQVCIYWLWVLDCWGGLVLRMVEFQLVCFASWCLFGLGFARIWLFDVCLFTVVCGFVWFWDFGGCQFECLCLTVILNVEGFGLISWVLVILVFWINFWLGFAVGYCSFDVLFWLFDVKLAKLSVLVWLVWGFDDLLFFGWTKFRGDVVTFVKFGNFQGFSCLIGFAYFGKFWCFVFDFDCLFVSLVALDVLESLVTWMICVDLPNLVVELRCLGLV